MGCKDFIAVRWVSGSIFDVIDWGPPDLSSSCLYIFLRVDFDGPDITLVCREAPQLLLNLWIFHLGTLYVHQSAGFHSKSRGA